MFKRFLVELRMSIFNFLIININNNFLDGISHFLKDRGHRLDLSDSLSQLFLDFLLKVSNFHNITYIFINFRLSLFL